MRRMIALVIVINAWFASHDSAQMVRGAFPSPSIQILPMMVAAERGFYKREGLDLELVFVRGAATVVPPFLSRRLAAKGFTVLGRCEETRLPSVGMTVLVERPYLQQNADTLQNVMMALIEGMLYTGHPRNKSIVMETLTKQFRMTDPAIAEGAYQDVSTLVRLEEARKPYVSLESMRILQRLLAPGNPKIASLKVENLIDSTIVKRIEDSGFFDKMNAEYGGK